MQQNIEFERCIDFLVRMIDKYGEEVLRELEEEKQNKEEKEEKEEKEAELFGCIIFYFCKLRIIFTFTLKYNTIQAQK